MARRTNSCRRQRGFAYLWTLMLVAFMGVGLTIAADLYATAMRRDKERELLFIGHEFRHALEGYNKANGAGQYPLTLDELLKDPRFPSAKRHLRRLYNDPITGKPDWALVLQQGRIVGIRSTSAQRPIKQDNFDDDDAGLAKKPRYADWLFTYPHDLFTVPQNADAKR
ncbi:type II secretion system protein [Duganella caerulea]|uniref:type II secretion system protein n=1 Tax=Duganella caerulea TaxID=2885762 RepID=UPI0040383775